MKIKSREKGVLMERWRTPVANAQHLWLRGLLQTASHAHFFFSTTRHFETLKKRCDIHVMTIGRTWPYRLVEEEYAYSCIGRYFHPHYSEKKRMSRPISLSNTWKLWGTDFIKDLDHGRALSDYKEVQHNNIFEYLIQTEDEWIEFISGPPRWTLLRNMTAKAAVRSYINKF